MEEISIVIIKIPVGLRDVFTTVQYNIDFAEAMVELAEHAGLDEEAIWNSDIEFNSIVESNGYIRIDHDLANWSDLSEKFVKMASSIEYYSIHQTGFGLTRYYSLNDKQDRLTLQHDSESDSTKDEARKIKVWRESFSDQLMEAFPKAF